MIPKRSGTLDLQDPGSGILEHLGSYIFISHGILEILDSAKATLSWDPMDTASRTEKILLDPGDPGSSLDNLPRDLADLGSCPTIM